MDGEANGVFLSFCSSLGVLRSELIPPAFLIASINAPRPSLASPNIFGEGVAATGDGAGGAAGGAGGGGGGGGDGGRGGGAGAEGPEGGANGGGGGGGGGGGAEVATGTSSDVTTSVSVGAAL